MGTFAILLLALAVAKRRGIVFQVVFGGFGFSVPLFRCFQAAKPGKSGEDGKQGLWNVARSVWWGLINDLAVGQNHWKPVLSLG